MHLVCVPSVPSVCTSHTQAPVSLSACGWPLRMQVRYLVITPSMLSYKIGLFDVAPNPTPSPTPSPSPSPTPTPNQAKTWEDVVEALVSNTPERTEEVCLVLLSAATLLPHSLLHYCHTTATLLRHSLYLLGAWRACHWAC